MIFEIVDSTSGPLETHASKNTKFSPLRGLAPFLPPASWGVSRSSFLWIPYSRPTPRPVATGFRVHSLSFGRAWTLAERFSFSSIVCSFIWTGSTYWATSSIKFACFWHDSRTSKSDLVKKNLIWNCKGRELFWFTVFDWSYVRNVCLRRCRCVGFVLGASRWLYK